MMSATVITSPVRPGQALGGAFLRTCPLGSGSWGRLAAWAEQTLRSVGLFWRLSVAVFITAEMRRVNHGEELLTLIVGNAVCHFATCISH